MPEVMLIIPCYNEASRLPSQRILSFLTDHPNIHLCLVNDGSTDGTGELVENLKAECPGRITTLHLAENSGKAEAVRRAMVEQISHSNAEWFGYWDADLATPLEEIGHLLQSSPAQVKIAMGSRVKRLGATIDRHAWRHILGRMMATLISMALKLPVYDTQCGAKLIRREEAAALFSEVFISKWLFDVEIIARMKMRYPDGHRCGYFLEVPVSQWRDISGSKLKMSHMLFALIDVLKIYRTYKF